MKKHSSDGKRYIQSVKHAKFNLKDMLKSVLIGIEVALLQWIFLALFMSLSNGMSKEIVAIAGVGSFLAFELVICTGLVISKVKKAEVTIPICRAKRS